MTDYESLLNRWQSAGVLDADTTARIRAWESAQGTIRTTTREAESQSGTQVAGIAWQGRVALILGGILLASGVVLFVSAHWDQLGPGHALPAGDGDGHDLSPRRSGRSRKI